MAALMFKIANETHASARTLRNDLPDCLSQIIDRMMEKDADKRYQRGAEIVADLRNCMAAMEGAA
jgi:serine/threonine-protein kinase